MESLFYFGIGLIQILQMLSPALDALMKFFTFLGTIEFYLILMPLLYWTVNPRLGIRVLLILISVDAVGSFLKKLLHQPRPYWVGDVKDLSTDPFYGNPSTHASNTLAIWGFLSYSLRRRWLWISAIVLVLLIGISRLYLGVHFPHDVVGGWLLGAALLYLILRGEQRILPWLQEQSAGMQIRIGFGASVVLMLVGLLVGVLISGSPDPEAWAHFANAARSPAHYFTLGGALFGAVTGFVLMLQRATFDPGGSWGQRGGSFILGMVGVLLLWRGLDVLFALIAADETTLGYILRYICYAATTAWATFGAPWMFLRVKLAHE